jgi:glycosyltransferase involved in cell wall biosynthesis
VSDTEVVQEAWPDPLVSVILCSYNQGTTIGKAIDSVLGQSYRNLELFIIDNGSNDNTAQILLRYEPDPRVRVLSFLNNDAVTKRLNDAVAASHGDFVSLLYADDYYLPHKIEKQIAAFSVLDETYGVVYSPGYRLNVLTGRRWVPRTVKKSGEVLPLLLREIRAGRFINPISPLVRRTCLLQHPFYEDIFVEGEANYLRIATTHQFFYAADPVVVMTEHMANIGKAFRRTSNDLVVLLERLRREPGFPTTCEQQLKRCLAMHHKTVGWQELRVTEDPIRVRECMKRSVQTSRWATLHPKVLIGWTLSFAPKPVLQFINRLGYCIRRSRDNAAFRDGYS